MYFAGTEMHMVTFCITVFEVVMFIFQVTYFLQRPGDKNRLRYLILLTLLILFNVCGGLFPDSDIPIPVRTQSIIAFTSGFAMAMYSAYYFYKVFDLRDLKLFVKYGITVFLLIPFLFLFLVPYLLTNNLALTRRLTFTLPFFYGIGFMIATTTSFIKKFKALKNSSQQIDKTLVKHSIAAYISILCWVSLPVILFLGDFQVLVHVVANAGFMLMTVVYIHSSIRQARAEYDKLLQSQHNLKELNKDLAKKVEERTRNLEQLHEQRTNTFVNFAHETKTPLTLINNYLHEVIQSQETPELRVVKYNIEKLTSDIVNLFDIERFNKGFEIYDHNQVCDFSTLLYSKIILFKSLASKKEIVMSDEIEAEVFVKADPGAIDRVINNLVENAIKYTPLNGKIQIVLATKQNQVFFSVADNGPGIPITMQKKVFEPYFQLSNSRKNNEGMGLGLSIVKKVIDGLGGEINLKSCEQHGTLIKISLIRLIPDESLLITEYKGSESLSFNSVPMEVSDAISDEDRPVVLIVEDNLFMLSYLRKKLKERYNVYVACNGGDALKKMKSIKVLDIIISDVMMGAIDGFEFCSALSKIERYKHVPLIFLTAKTRHEDKIKGLRLGAVDYIEKPFLIDHLLLKIETILNNSEKQKFAFLNSASRLILKNNNSASSKDETASFKMNCKIYGLTEREVEIVELLSKGLAYKEIAADLNISPKTVGSHVTNIFSKVEAGNKVELINKLNSP